MSLEKRPDGIYFYRARKEAGRVVKTYDSAGPAAVMAHAIDAGLRAERQAQAEAERLALAVFEAEETGIEELCRRVEGVARATLLGAGYHRHERGDWRKRRG